MQDPSVVGSYRKQTSKALNSQFEKPEISLMNQKTPLHPAYFETRYRLDTPGSDWPENFAIITAYATTGETWTEEQNLLADQKLENELRSNYHWLQRVTGYSPTSGHAERGWAVEIPWVEACAIGLKYKQHAIYYVSRDELQVTLCDDHRELVHVGNFRERLD